MRVKTTLRWFGKIALIFAWLSLSVAPLQVSVEAMASAGASVPTPGAEAPVPAPALPIESPWSSVTPQTGLASQQTSSSAVIVDNSSPGFRVETGEWGTCFDGDCSGTCYGDDFRYADPECTSCRARFDLTVSQDGDYDVWAWWPWGEDRSIDTPFMLTSSQGDITVNVDQRNSGDGWFWLISLPLRANEPVSIAVQGTATGYANADAVALTPLGAGPPSTVTTDVASPEVDQSEGETSETGLPVIQYFYSEAVPERPVCYYLHWEVTNATTIYLNDLPLDPSGSAETCPEVTGQYTLHAENATGEVEQVLALAGPGQDTSITAPLSPETSPATPQPIPETSGSVSIIFLHHSCGANLIAQGSVREQLTALGYSFYDHGYNGDGLVLADGTWTGRHFDVPDDNTNPDGFAAIFAQPLHDPPDNTFSHLMQYDVIVFKSCFPVSLIDSDEQLAEYKAHYTSIRNRMDQHPDKLFIIVTQPPEIPNDTNPEAAARARAFTNWLAAPEFLAGHPNVVTFNFFDLLADPATNMLRTEYLTDDYDAHPNELANRTIGPIFSQFVDSTIRDHQLMR